jgi:amino acid adenylation domain-containing protein/non-ribosomal peptide synthase protein (TIGR01720 family)
MIPPVSARPSRRIQRLPRDRPLPLSFAQERLWFLDRLQPAGTVYTVVVTYVRQRGAVDEIALDRALAEVVRRHEALRTRFPDRGGRPFQEILPRLAVPLAHGDLSALPAGRRLAEARQRVRELADAPFDLARGPLLRACLLHLAPNDRLFLVSVHHIVFDGWSVALFDRELRALYGAFAAGLPSPLPDLPLQPADAAFAERLALRQPPGAPPSPLLSYWRQRLAGVPPLLAIPTDHPRPAIQRHRGARQSLGLGPAGTTAFRGLCRQQRATLFVGLFAVFAALLARLAGSEDVPVGVPIAGRPEPEIEGMIGFFVNTVVLRADLGGDPSFRTLLDRLLQVAIEAFTHQGLPFARLVDELAAGRDLSHSPLVQVVLSFQTALAPAPAVAGVVGSSGAVGLPGVASEEQEIAGSTAKFDLTLGLAEQDGALAGAIEHDTDLFTAATAERIARGFLRLLTVATAEPDRPLSTLPLLAEAERHQLVVEWNDTRRPYPEATLPALFAVQARRRPDAVALVCGDAQLTYAALDRRTDRLARRLRARGVGPEIPVGLFAPRPGTSGMTEIVGLLGILKAGGAYVPLDPAEPPERLRRRTEALPVVLSAADPDLDEAALDREDVRDDEPGASAVGPESLAYVIHTSGSTGQPKGVAVPHRAVVRLVIGTDYAELGPEEVCLGLAPLAFDASTFEVWGSLLTGGRLILPPPTSEGSKGSAASTASSEEIGDLLGRYQVTVLWLTAGLFHVLVETQPERLAGVRQLLAGGDVLSPGRVRELLARRTSGRLVDGYGPTEATTFTCCHVLRGRELPEASVPLGRPIANTRVQLLDRHLAPVPLGAPGEIWIGGDGLARGYFRDPASTADRFRPDPFPPAGEAGDRLYRTGDLARLLPDGRLDFLGRTDAQVKVRGFRVEPAEIEAALSAHPAVRQAAVLAEEAAGTPGTAGTPEDAGAPSPAVGRRLAAYLVVDPERAPRSPELRAFLRNRLPDYLLPAVFRRLDEIPLSVNGKVDRRALQAQRGTAVELGGGEGVGLVAPRTPAERTLQEIWQAVLGRAPISVHDNFFDLGGDSLLAIQMVSRATQAGLPASVRLIFQHQTIAELASALPGMPAAAPPGEPATEQGWVTGAVPLTPGQRWFFERVLPKLRSPHDFSTPELLLLRGPLPPRLLARAVERLVFQHDALRLRVVPPARPGGEWEQVLPGAEGLVGLFACVDLEALPPARRDECTVDAAGQLLAQPDLSVPLARFVYLPPGRLLLVLHHLISDGASWRLLSADLETLCRQLAAGDEPRLPAKTTSFKAWAERQHELARSPGLRQQMEDWLALAAEGAARLPVDGNGIGDRRDDEVGTVTLTLPAAATRTLLESLPAAAGVPFSSALLAGLARALARFTGSSQILLRQTDHGRNPDVPGVDLSRTVGWITTTAPVLLTPDAAGNAAEGSLGVLRAIDAQLRQVPLRGLGYGLLRYLSGDPEVARRMETVVASPLGTFNFLGRFATAPEADGAEEPPFLTVSEIALRPSPALGQPTPQLRISGYVGGSPPELRMTVAYGKGFYREETMMGLAEGIREELRRLLDSE